MGINISASLQSCAHTRSTKAFPLCMYVCSSNDSSFSVSHQRQENMAQTRHYQLMRNMDVEAKVKNNNKK